MLEYYKKMQDLLKINIIVIKQELLISELTFYLGG